MAIRESFLCKIWGCGTLVLQKRAIRENFLRENHIFHHFAKVSPLKVSRYTVTFNAGNKNALNFADTACATGIQRSVCVVA